MVRCILRAKMFERAVFTAAILLLTQTIGCNPQQNAVSVRTNPQHELEVFSEKSVQVRHSNIKDGMEGVELEGLTEEQKQLVIKLLNEVPCDCGCRITTVAECRVDIPDCGEGERQAEFIVDQVKEGKSEAQIVRELYAQTLSHRFRRDVKPLLNSISPDKEKDYMAGQLARLAAGVDVSSLKTSNNELADARAVSALFLGDARKGILPYLEGVSDELYILHGVTWELIQPPSRPLFEYYFYGHRPECQKQIMPFLNPTVPEAEMIMGMALNFFGPPETPGGFKVSPGDSPSRGPKNASVVLIEFSDFECPYSGRVQPTIEKVIKAYPDKVRHVYKNFPLNFHRNAKLAAQAVLAAEKQGKFWEMHKMIFRNQRKLSRLKIEDFAKEIGLDIERFKKDLDSIEIRRKVQNDFDEARRAGVSSTPTVFVNDKMIKGAQGYCAFREIIEEVLNK